MDRSIYFQGKAALITGASKGMGLATAKAFAEAAAAVMLADILEYAPRGIRLNAVCPGTIRTPVVEDMFTFGGLSEEDVVKLAPINRLGKAPEIADAMLWL